MTDLSITIEKRIEAPIDKVFDAWLNPITLAKFMQPAPDMPDSPTTTDARVGGRFEIIMHVGENQIPHRGEYLEIDRPHKLSFTWESPASLDDSVVTLSFSAVENKATNIVLTHVKFIDEERRSNHEGGWSRILTGLNHILQ
ncbi:MAG: SRPBCC domain-containing protein [Pseudomonadales bacterium]|nr:SRPBCC domain-containing protein [Pseudomonadales bacterium]